MAPETSILGDLRRRAWRRTGASSPDAGRNPRQRPRRVPPLAQPDVDRLHVELTYLSILTTQFALGVALGAGEPPRGSTRPLSAGSGPARPGVRPRADWQARLPEPRDTFNHPHPELGRAYGIGRTFARHCGCSHEVAAIEFGARAYMGQLPRMLGLLRSLTVDQRESGTAARWRLGQGGGGRSTVTAWSCVSAPTRPGRPSRSGH